MNKLASTSGLVVVEVLRGRFEHLDQEQDNDSSYASNTEDERGDNNSGDSEDEQLRFMARVASRKVIKKLGVTHSIAYVFFITASAR